MFPIPLLSPPSPSPSSPGPSHRRPRLWIHDGAAVCQCTGKGLHPRPRQGAEAHRGHTCLGRPALWVLNLTIPWFSTLCAPPAFVCSSSPSCSIHQPLDNLPSQGEALEAPIKASGQRPAQRGCLIGPSQVLLLSASATKKEAARGPPAPQAPNTIGWQQRHFPGRQVLVSDSAQSAGAEERRGWGSRAVQTCRGRTGRAPGEDSREQEGQEGKFQRGVSRGRRPVSEFTHPSPGAGWLGKPAGVSVLPCANIAVGPLRILI